MTDAAAMQELADEDAGDPGEALPDERLRLIFTDKLLEVLS